MSFLTGSSKTPAPAPLPESPGKSEEAEQQRLDAERAAIAEQKSAGRRSTIVAGMGVKEDDADLMKSSKKRSAARDLGG